MEIVIASSVFALLMTAVIGVFRSSSGSFQAGNWQLQTQKHAQAFLTSLRDLLEQASYADSFNSTAIPTIATLPIYIKTAYRNPAAEIVTSAVGGVLFFSVTSAFTKANPLLGTTVDKRGTWMGVTLAVSSNPNPGTGRTLWRLTLQQSGADADHNSLAAAPYGKALSGANFDSVPANRSLRLDLEDLYSLKVTTTEPGTIVVSITLRRVFGTRPVVIRESIRAKLLHPDHPFITY
ncbi:MAG: hypothetical protein WA705_27320 [Candidatus Ozemobacteraceae bacterium]